MFLLISERGEGNGERETSRWARNINWATPARAWPLYFYLILGSGPTLSSPTLSANRPPVLSQKYTSDVLPFDLFPFPAPLFLSLNSCVQSYFQPRILGPSGSSESEILTPLCNPLKTASGCLLPNQGQMSPSHGRPSCAHCPLPRPCCAHTFPQVSLWVGSSFEGNFGDQTGNQEFGGNWCLLRSMYVHIISACWRHPPLWFADFFSVKALMLPRVTPTFFCTVEECISVLWWHSVYVLLVLRLVYDNPSGYENKILDLLFIWKCSMLMKF